MAKKSAKPLPGFANLLFTTKFGTPICDQIMIDAIDRIIDEINLTRDELEKMERFTPHCLRHTFATRCFESNVPAKTVQGYLGHASIQMTLDLYTHVMEEQKQSDMTKLENTLDDVFTGGDEYAEANFKKACAEEKKVIKFECVG